MASKMLEYSAHILNESGYRIHLPRVAKVGDLLTDAIPNPYAESATPLFPVGTEIWDGPNGFVYCKAGASALNIAAPLQNAKAVHAEQDDDIVVGAAAAIGATQVSVTSTANLDGSPNDVTNDFAGGYLVVNDVAGEGQLYRIKSNAALVTTGNSIFELADALTIALTTSSQIGLIRDPAYKVIATEAVLSGMFMGVPLMAVTAAYYFWSKIHGPAPVIPNAAIALGTWAVVGTTAAKADPAAALTTEVIIGYPLTPAVADTETFICFLTGGK